MPTSILGRPKQRQPRTSLIRPICKTGSTLQGVSILKAGSGPVAASLDVTLQEHNIRRQKYHGKSYVRNDCNKYLQKEGFRDVCASIISKTEELTHAVSQY